MSADDADERRFFYHGLHEPHGRFFVRTFYLTQRRKGAKIFGLEGSLFFLSGTVGAYFFDMIDRIYMIFLGGMGLDDLSAFGK